MDEQHARAVAAGVGHHSGLSLIFNSGRRYPRERARSERVAPAFLPYGAKRKSPFQGHSSFAGGASLPSYPFRTSPARIRAWRFCAISRRRSSAPIWARIRKSRRPSRRAR